MTETALGANLPEVGPWAAFPEITRPMFVVLYDAAVSGRDRLTRGVYPAGQLRLIKQGLYGRELIGEDEALTPAGHALAERIRLAVAAYWPVPEEGQRS